MTTTTIFSSVSYNQNINGIAPLPAPTIVNAGGLITQRVYTLTVTPSTGWAKAAIKEGPDGVNFPRGTEVFVAPNSGGTATDGFAGLIDPPIQYFSGEVLEVSPGATATLTVTY